MCEGIYVCLCVQCLVYVWVVGPITTTTRLMITRHSSRYRNPTFKRHFVSASCTVAHILERERDKLWYLPYEIIVQREAVSGPMERSRYICVLEGCCLLPARFAINS